MKPLRAFYLSAVALTIIAPAHAQSANGLPSEEQSKALEAQLRAAIADISAGAIPLPARPIELTPEGDHYLVRIPLSNFAKFEPTDAAITANAKMLDATRWEIDDQKLPSILKFTVDEVVPEALDSSNAEPLSTRKSSVTYDIKLGQQNTRGVFDPTFSTPTVSDSTISSVDIIHTGGTSPNVLHLTNLVSQTSIHPVDTHHIDLLSDTTALGYTTTSVMPDGTTFKISADKLRIVSAITNLAQYQLVSLVHLAAHISKASSTKPGPKLDAMMKADLRKLLVSANSLLTGARVDETAEGIRVDFGTHAGAIGKFEIAAGGDAPQDMLSTTMNFVLDGLTIDDLPPAFASYVPTHIAIRPTVSNISVADLTKIATDATAPGAPPPAPDAFQILFNHGGINIGFDSLGLDIAGTKFTGTGKFTMTGPQSVSGQAELSAHGLDALINKAQTDPMLAKGLPVIIFLKGIAHTTPDEAVWQISVANEKMLVNGVDLSAMVGAMK